MILTFLEENDDESAGAVIFKHGVGGVKQGELGHLNILSLKNVFSIDFGGGTSEIDILQPSQELVVIIDSLFQNQKPDKHGWRLISNQGRAPGEATTHRL